MGEDCGGDEGGGDEAEGDPAVHHGLTFPDRIIEEEEIPERDRSGDDDEKSGGETELAPRGEGGPGGGGGDGGAAKDGPEVLLVVETREEASEEVCGVEFFFDPVPECDVVVVPVPEQGDVESQLGDECAEEGGQECGAEAAFPEEPGGLWRLEWPGEVCGVGLCYVSHGDVIAREGGA